MKKHVSLSHVLILVSVLLMMPSAGAAAAEKISIPANNWMSLRTTGDGDVAVYGSGGLPRPRGWHQASFDLETREVVIFGGSSSTYMSDTWTFNLNEKVWHLRRPHPDLSGPCRRDMHNLVYEPIGKLHWLFNGIAYDNLQPECGRGATWTYNRSRNEWVKVSVSGDRMHRLAPGVAYNPDTRELLQFGGEAVGNVTNTTVRFNVAERRWQLVRTKALPPPRRNIQGGLIYDRAHRVFVLFGGRGQKGPLNDTWTFDPRRQEWERKTPPVSPPRRDLHSMAYDESSEKVILFGGRGAGNQGNLNDTWIYDVAEDAWTELRNTGNPRPMSHQSAVFDPINQVTVVVNGRDTLVFRYEPSSISSSRTPNETHSRRRIPDVAGVSSDTKEQGAKVSYLVAGRNAANLTKMEHSDNQQQHFENGSSEMSEKKLDIPIRTWIARRLPGRGNGPWGLMKHLRLAFNPKNQRIYFLGGDYAGRSDVSASENNALASGRNEIFSYSIANNNWKLEHPYCAAGGVQPSHPDEVGWVYDTKRNIFWMLPGYMGGDQGLCPEAKLIRWQIMTFDPETRKWDWPKKKSSGGQANAKKFAQYDVKKDQIVRFAWTNYVESEVYDIGTDSWSIKRHNGRGYQIGQEYTAMDAENRRIYVIAPAESRLFGYDMDPRVFHDLGAIPARSRTDHTNPVWDPINKVLLWPQIADRSGLITLYVYDPKIKQWEKMPMNEPNGMKVTGVDAVFDPIHNALMVLGGTSKPATNHIFLYRFGKGHR